MRKFRVLCVLTLVLLLLLIGAPAAAASTPFAVSFEVQTPLLEDDPDFAPFTASGPAVEEGIVCPSGDVIDTFFKPSGFQSKTGGMNLQIVKRFTCDDGSGEFSVKLQVRLDRKGDSFHWKILAGTGAYEDLHGTGSGTGAPFPGGVLDLYKGKVH